MPLVPRPIGWDEERFFGRPPRREGRGDLRMTKANEPAARKACLPLTGEPARRDGHSQGEGQRNNPMTMQDETNARSLILVPDKKHRDQIRDDIAGGTNAAGLPTAAQSARAGHCFNRWRGRHRWVSTVPVDGYTKLRDRRVSALKLSADSFDISRRGDGQRLASRCCKPC